MIIKKMTINSFGAIVNKEIMFTEGLNVILGPNESGKSTMFNALLHTFFTPSKLTKHQFKKSVERFLPIGGGDTADVTVDFIYDGKIYSLKKNWGITKISALTLPNGSFISDETEIQDIIENCMEVSEGTCKTVMLAYQSGLPRTLSDLKNNSETIQSLGNILRKTVMEMDGVSVDAFKSKIEENFTKYFSHWDREAKYPERNRGIENPYKKSLGTIIRAFYEKEQVRNDLETAQSYEAQLDELNKKIAKCFSDLDQKETYLTDHKKAKEDAVRGRQFVAELHSFEMQYDKLQDVNRNWPVEENQIKKLKSDIPKFEELAKKLEKEKLEIQRANRYQELLKRFERVETKKINLDRAEKELVDAKKLTSEDLKKIRNLVVKKQNLESSLEAGKITISFNVQKKTELTVLEGVDAETEVTVTPQKNLNIKTDGRIKLIHSDWDMEVVSGEIDFEELLKQYQTTNNDLKALMNKYQVKDLEQAENYSTNYYDKLAQKQTAKEILEDELGEDTLEELKNEVKNIKITKPKKDIDTIINDLVETQSKFELSMKEMKDLKEKILNYEKEYKSPENLLKELVQIVAKKDKTQQEIENLLPLPNGEDDPQKFIDKYVKTEEIVNVLKEKKNELIQEKIRLEQQAPDRSVEEYQKDIVEAEACFEMELRNGEAIARIKEKITELLAKFDSETYLALENEIRAIISTITGGRYQEIQMEETLPYGFKRKDGEIIPYDRLSTGTLDVLAIALRLAITNKFLENKPGFIMMDDPLVDLDPERQSKAAKVIREFSNHKQVIIFTCHPTHAIEFDGNQINLEL